MSYRGMHRHQRAQKRICEYRLPQLCASFPKLLKQQRMPETEMRTASIGHFRWVMKQGDQVETYQQFARVRQRLRVSR